MVTSQLSLEKILNEENKYNRNYLNHKKGEIKRHKYPGMAEYIYNLIT